MQPCCGFEPRKGARGLLATDWASRALTLACLEVVFIFSVREIGMVWEVFCDDFLTNEISCMAKVEY